MTYPAPKKMKLIRGVYEGIVRLLISSILFIFFYKLYKYGKVSLLRLHPRCGMRIREIGV